MQIINTDTPTPKIVLKDISILKFFWYLFALTIPLFSISDLRIESGFFHFAIPMYFLLFVLYITSIIFAQSNGRFQKKNQIKDYTIFLLLTFLFVLAHLHSYIFYTEYISEGLKILFKIIIGCFFFWVTILSFPRDPKFITNFFILSFFSWSLLLIRLIYQYAFVFKQPYLSTDLYTISRYGKNMLATHLIVAFFYCFFMFVYKKSKRIVISIPLIILIFSLIYTGSRMGWMGTMLGIVYTSIFILISNRKEGKKLIRNLVLGGAIVITSLVYPLSKVIDLTETTVRVISIFSPSSVPDAQWNLGKNSYNQRGTRIYKALKGFASAPIFGIGIANWPKFLGSLTHNDYATLLMELGLVGTLIFLLFLFFIWKKSLKFTFDKDDPLLWFKLAARSSFIGILIILGLYNCYPSVYIWVYFAFIVVACDLENTKKDPLLSLQNKS